MDSRLYFVLGDIASNLLVGALEVMLPTMFGGMLSGMVVGMWAAMHPISGITALLVGAGCGLVGINVIWVLNIGLRGRRSYPREG